MSAKYAKYIEWGCDKIDNRDIRLKKSLLDWENEMNYQKRILKSGNASEDQKRHAKERIEEAQYYIDRIKQEQNEIAEDDNTSKDVKWESYDDMMRRCHPNNKSKK